MAHNVAGIAGSAVIEKLKFMLYTKDELLNAAGYTSIRPAQMTRLFEVIEELKAEQEQALQQCDVMRAQSAEPATPPTHCLCGAEIPADDPYDGYCTDCG